MAGKLISSLIEQMLNYYGFNTFHLYHKELDILGFVLV